jgi:hypothetical protein
MSPLHHALLFPEKKADEQSVLMLIDRYAKSRTRTEKGAAETNINTVSIHAILTCFWCVAHGTPF